MSPHQVYIANDIAYVVARNGDTFKDLGKEFDISWKKLVKYNDLQRDYTLMEGDIIYLKSKKKKASKPYTVYVRKMEIPCMASLKNMVSASKICIR